MIADLAVVICNFNKKEYVLKCIESVLESVYKDLDIYIVDNGSTDESVENIRSKYRDKVNLIIIEKNIGSSGGFNTGIKEVLKYEYKYVMLLDNDVIIEKNATNVLYCYLEDNLDVAIAGSKIYSMDRKEQIQELGAKIDFENYTIKPYYKGFIDNQDIPQITYCDYVPSCSLMVRVQAIKEVGIMDEKNFMYWDDIDWCYRFKLKGYKIVALAKSKVWHKMGVKSNTNTLNTYYFWRNRVKFFMTYCNSIQKEEFIKVIFDELFQSIYMCNYIGKYSSGRTIVRAVNDGINGVYGRADNKKIDEIEKIESIEDKLRKLLDYKKRVFVIDNGDINILRNVIDILKMINENFKFKIVISDNKEITNQFNHSGEEIVRCIEEIKESDIVIKLCNHILDLRNTVINEKYIYIDRYLNIIKDLDDITYIKNYNNQKKFIYEIFYPIIFNELSKKGE